MRSWRLNRGTNRGARRLIAAAAPDAAGAATAIAGLRGGFSDLSLSNYCQTSNMCAAAHPAQRCVAFRLTRRLPRRSFCRKLVGATVMSYMAWLSMAPSLYINIADNEDGPW